VLADIPGLIEGAHEGVGIGDRFLGHVERTRVLLHLVSALEEDVAEAYRVVRHELEAYGHGIAEKPEVVALSQVDVVDAEARAEKVRALKKAAGRAPYELSAITGEGMTGVLRALRDVIVKDRARPGHRRMMRATAARLKMTASRKPLCCAQAHRHQDRLGAAGRSRKSGLKAAWLESLCTDIAALKKAGADVLVVSSGAIALGRTVLGLPSTGRSGLRKARPPPPSARLRSRAPGPLACPPMASLPARSC
jgi:hypothetical protein